MAVSDAVRDPDQPRLSAGSRDGNAAKTDADAASTRERLTILWSFTRPQAPRLLLGLLLALAVSAMGLASPMVTKWVLDTLDAGGSLRAPVLLLTVLLVVGAVVGWYQWTLMGRVAEDIVRDARRRMIMRYLGARVFALLSRGPGELVTRVTSDTVLLNQAASSAVIGLINGSIMLAGSLVLMAALDLVLLGATLLVVAVIFLLFVVLMPRIAAVEEKSQAALSSLGTELEGTVRAIKTVKSSGAETRRLRALMHHVDESRHQALRSVRIQAGAWTIAGTGLDAAVILVLAFGAFRVSTGEITVSTLVAFLLYVWGLSGPLMELTQNLSTLQSGLAAAGRIRQIEQMPQEARVTWEVRRGGGEDSAARGPTGSGGGLGDGAPGAAPALEFSEITAGYEGAAEPAVRDLDLSIPRSGHIALVGASGAGKTTVFNLMMRFLEPEHGSIRLFGEEYRELSPTRTRAAFAYVEQETPVVPGTIGENLLFTNPEADRERVRAVTEQLGLSAFIDGLPNGLDTPLTETSTSGGQRQRISLARALLADARILLLDEATAQVDGLTEAAVQAAIAGAAEERAVVTIAHRLSTVADADEILVMDAGRITARGTHTQLLRESAYYRSLVAALRMSTETPAG
ncbi:ABC transporter ATP-binding protein [Brevibacterium album]|uniref:ABC transporter ATP-binding protein n=1 Tax=Brevibacterium album TaxID=417948 RepID=UPI000410F1AC|nr:ABC transporter ATP-binding protein [Brevibacterium album]